MEELLALIIQIAIEILTSGLGDLIVYSYENNSNHKLGKFAMVVTGSIAGGLTGGLSLNLFPNHIIKYSFLRIVMLFVMPIVNGIISYFIASNIKKFRDISIGAHIAFAVSFTFLMLAIRLAYIKN